MSRYEKNLEEIFHSIGQINTEIEKKIVKEITVTTGYPGHIGSTTIHFTDDTCLELTPMTGGCNECDPDGLGYGMTVSLSKPAAKKEPYVTVIQGCGGYNSCLMTWDEECKGYTPFETGCSNTLGNGSLKTAIGEAKAWAESEGVPYKGPEK